MTFSITNFAPVGNTSKPLTGFGTATLKGAPSVWSFATNDTLATVNTAGYFNDASKHLNVGDLIYGVCDTDGTPAPALFYVNANASGVVDVADGTTVSVTDTD